ncbi:MAG TPA: hypothetical protein VE046_10290 [Steroidobacteraceae bacterium]|nr:hypothetical protein [Steroidobacteraceae bacterium]
MSADAEAAHARLAESRVALRQMLDSGDDDAGDGGGSFPRSRTMRLLVEHPALAIAAAVVGGMLILKPGTLRRVARTVPLAAVGRMLLMRYLARSLGS